MGEIKYIEKAVLDKCPDCGSDNLEIAKVDQRGTGNSDKHGLFCLNCRVLWLNK